MIERITLDASGASEAMDLAARAKQSSEATTARNIGGVTVKHNGLDKTTRVEATDNPRVMVGGVEMQLRDALERGFVHVNDDGSIGSSDPDVLEVEKRIQSEENEKEAEAKDINEVFARGDQALDFLNEHADPGLIAEASKYFSETGDLEEIAKALPATAVQDYADAKVAWADHVLADTGASVDFLTAAADGYEAQEMRKAAIRGDATTLRRLADNVVRNVDTNENFARALQNGGLKITRGIDGKFSVQTENGLVPLSVALRSGWLYGG